MRKTLLPGIAAVTLVGLSASCGRGGGDDEYDFNGRWATNEVVTASSHPGTPVGSTSNDVLRISESGNNVTVQFESIASVCTMQGVSDGKAKTFTASGVCTGDLAGVRIDINGTGLDEDTINGAYSMSGGGRTIFANYGANLLSHSLAVSFPAGRGGKAALFLK